MKQAELNQALTSMLADLEGVSDINFTVGKPAQVEVSGELKPVPFQGSTTPLTREQTQGIAEACIEGSEHLRALLETQGSTDCALGIEDGRRFRVNVFTARGSRSVVLRALPSSIPDRTKLDLPEVLGEIPKLVNGMVLVVGATGSGKSTTLAAVIDEINRTRPVHVVTLEDPIEFVHPHKLATINQRELGRDFDSFADALKAALRQAPKVILVGELRDRESMEIGLKAAETGHLVLSTLHTIDAGQTINRITGMFDKEERDLVRMRLCDTLRFVVAQRLLPASAGGRVAALEVMGTNLSTRELILNGESPDRTFPQVIADGKVQGWQSFDQHIAELFQKGRIDKRIARAYATDPSWVGREIDRIRALRGDATAGIGDLQMMGLKPARR